MSRRSRRRWIGVLLTLLVAACVGLAATGLYAIYTPYGAFETGMFVQIERGSSTRAIARQLADAGVIQHEWAFLAQRALRPGMVLQAGEYQFTEPATVAEVFGRLERGDIYFFDFTIPEGSNIWDIARLLEMQGIASEEDFLKAASDPQLIRDLDPAAESLEGYLFPSTYRLSHATTAADLCKMMVDEFRKRWRQLKGEGPPHATVTLASLVEKETGIAGERPLVAGVFLNRLEIGMPLACDPTVIYASLLLGKYRGTIYRSDLDRDHPYNTYKNAGLPPGPIANPGVDSLAAALRPADTDYLFFVASPTGQGHVFSSTGAAHARAVQNYRNAAARGNQTQRSPTPSGKAK